MGKHVNVEFDENGREVRPKKSKQYSKEELANALEVCSNKDEAAEYLGLGSWSFREQLKRHNLDIDLRGDANRKKAHKMAPKEELIGYLKSGMSVNSIKDIYQVSHPTITKWILDYGIDRASLSRDIEHLEESDPNVFITSPYLTEENLGDALRFVYGVPLSSQVNIDIPIGNNVKRCRIDYSMELNGQLYYIEYNGPRHYTTTKTIIRDSFVREYCKENNIRFVEIPYFVQLTQETLSYYFPNASTTRYVKSSILHGFITKGVLLPCDFSQIGYSRFFNEVYRLPEEVISEIMESLESPDNIETMRFFEDFMKIRVGG